MASTSKEAGTRGTIVNLLCERSIPRCNGIRGILSRMSTASTSRGAVIIGALMTHLSSASTPGGSGIPRILARISVASVRWSVGWVGVSETLLKDDLPEHDPLCKGALAVACRVDAACRILALMSVAQKAATGGVVSESPETKMR